MLQIGAASSLQIRASAVINWGSYYKLGQPLLQNRVAKIFPQFVKIVGKCITDWGRYYKLGKLLQIGAQQLLSLTYLSIKISTEKYSRTNSLS